VGRASGLQFGQGDRCGDVFSGHGLSATERSDPDEPQHQVESNLFWSQPLQYLSVVLRPIHLLGTC
jgi:hypothetical protein